MPLVVACRLMFNVFIRYTYYPKKSGSKEIPSIKDKKFEKHKSMSSNVKKSDKDIHRFLRFTKRTYLMLTIMYIVYANAVNAYVKVGDWYNPDHYCSPTHTSTSLT